MAKTKKSKAKKSAGKPNKTANLSNLLLPALLLFVLGFLVYSNTLRHDYALDDYSAIKENFVVKRGFDGLGDVFTKHYRYGYWTGKGTLYRPLTLAMFATEWEIAEDSPGFYHFMNIFWYALSVIVLFLVLIRIFKNYNIILPFLAALIFLLHPVHTEVVANIKSRDEIMAMLFCLGALYALWNYLERNKILWLLAALLSYTLAMFSKENSITFLAVFPLTMFLFSKINWQKNAMLSTSFLIPAIIFIVTRKAVLGNVMLESVSVLDNFIVGAPDLLSQKATAFMMLGKYLQVLLFPHPLVSEYGYSQIATVSMTSWKALLPLAIFAGMGIWAIFNIKRHKVPAFGILLFLFFISIYSNVIITVGSSYGERFLYFPSLGFAIAFAWILLKIFKIDLTAKENTFIPAIMVNKALLATIIVLSLAFFYKTYDRNVAWYDSYSLYHADLEHAPNSSKLRFHHALELVQQGKKEKGLKAQELFGRAEKDFLRALEIYPEYADAYGELGLLYFRTNRLEKAMYSYEMALKRKPKASVYSNMGIIYFNQGNLDKAREVYEKAVELDPRFVDALRNLGSVHAQQKNFDQAIKYFNQALEYDPENATILYYLGLAYRDKGEPGKGRQYRIRANKLNPQLKVD